MGGREVWCEGYPDEWRGVGLSAIILSWFRKNCCLSEETTSYDDLEHTERPVSWEI